LLTNDEFVDVVDAVELLLLELKTLRAGRCRFRITHRFQVLSSGCGPGEEVAIAHLMDRGKEFYLRLSGTLLLLFDYLARHSHMPMSASQIVAGMRADPFYQKHASAAPCVRQSLKISRSSIKVYIDRLRKALGQAFRDARIPLDPRAVLVSEVTASNQVAYRLKTATVDWIHVKHPGPG